MTVVDLATRTAASLPSGSIDTLTKSVLGALVALAAVFAGWVFRDMSRTIREQRATIDALNAEFRRDVAPLLTKTAEALERAAGALDAATARGTRSR